MSFCVSPQPASLQTCSRSISPRLSGPARPCGRGKLAQFSLLQRYAVWWVAPPWPILPVPAVLFWLFVGSLLKSRLDGKMGVKWPKKGAKWRLLREHATLLFMTQLLYCHAVTLIVVEKSTVRQLATTIYSSRTCVENLGSQIFKKAQKRSIS